MSPKKTHFLNCRFAKSGLRVCGLECSEKTKSFNLKIPQPDSERRHSESEKKRENHFPKAESEHITYHVTTSQTEFQNRSQENSLIIIPKTVLKSGL